MNFLPIKAASLSNHGLCNANNDFIYCSLFSFPHKRCSFAKMRQKGSLTSFMTTLLRPKAKVSNKNTHFNSLTVLIYATDNSRLILPDADRK